MGEVYRRKTVLNCDSPTQNHREGLALYKIRDKYVYMGVF